MSTQVQSPVPVAPAAPIPVTQIGAPGTSLEALQAQAIDLNAQLAGLRAERDVLRSVINSSRSDPQFRASQAARYAELNGQMTRVDGQLDQVRARIAEQQGVATNRIGQTGQLIPPPPLSRRGPDPDMVVGLSFTLALFFVIPISIAWARRIWRAKGQPQPARTDEVLQRLDRLDQAVEAVAIEIERVAEGQRFVTKIMADRPAVPVARPGDPPQTHQASDAALGEAKPFLALGAGPIEPIRTPERQAVRRSITPH